MTTATLDLPRRVDTKAQDIQAIYAEQVRVIRLSLSTLGNATQQDAEGMPIGVSPSQPACAALLDDIDEDATAALSCMCRAVLQGNDVHVALHARSLVYQLVASAADLNACAIQNGEAVPVKFAAGVL